MKTLKRIFVSVLSAILTLSLFGCGNPASENPGSVSQEETTETDPVSLAPSESPTLPPETVPDYQTYSDPYVSFTYDSNLFTCSLSESGDSITITCPSLPAEPEDAHNTIIAFATIPFPEVAGASEQEARLGLSILTESLCQNAFPLKEGESVVDEQSTFSNYVAEYYMELSDGSKCYAKALNFNDYITTLIMRLCPYSADYNDSFMEIYSSAKSTYGNYDFASNVESSSAAESTSATEPASESASATESPSSDTAPATTPDSSSSSSVTTGQRNALKKANSYLKITAFSHDGLIGQLEFDGFTTEEATYAADNCGADWHEQALDKAKRYLNVSSFSYEGIIDQLKFDAFTDEQAAYAADNCGADWNEQASKKAKSYLAISSFSKSELIQQLEFEGFTHDQAVYGAQENGY